MKVMSERCHDPRVSGHVNGACPSCCVPPGGYSQGGVVCEETRDVWPQGAYR